MTLSLTHSKVSVKSDGVDTSFIQPSDWNAQHVITAAQYTVLGRSTGAGAVSDLAMDDVGVPLGAKLDFTGPSGSVPAKYLLGFGQAISRTTYADYFALVGTVYGIGDGSTTFNMPDFRGVVEAGIGNMGGVERGILNTFVASSLGAFGGSQSEQAGVSGTGTGTTGGPNDAHGVDDASPSFNVPTTFHIHNVSVTISGLTSPVTNVQPTIAMNKMVRVLR